MNRVICFPLKLEIQASQGPSRNFLVLIAEQRLKLLIYIAPIADGIKDDKFS